MFLQSGCDVAVKKKMFSIWQQELKLCFSRDFTGSFLLCPISLQKLSDLIIVLS